ncbi:outer membrane beta-barrel protein [Altibacter sp.]|uniref:outer membrane beta-barrel protein n=1 Tax=Altibacter sp. TaxID=2024823 RepID=UPI002584E83E|nr:outer membrane beta-barrel protein [Altibacter sp.]MCW9037477.1 outer membrane beta-barrel protein [Altibacter sp.]
MKVKKHIDELFKDRFKNFEATPSPRVWENIQAQLQEEKEDRKVIPIWWKAAGVAALLALLLTIGNAVFDPFAPTTSISSEETSVPESTDVETKKTPILKDAPYKEGIATEASSLPENNNETSEKEKKKAVNATKDPASITAREAVATTTASEVQKNKKKNAITDPRIGQDTETVTAAKKEKEAIATVSEKEKTTQKIAEKNDPLIKKELKIDDATAIGVTEKNTKEAGDKNTSEETKTEEIKKRSLLDAINEKDSEEAVVDTKKEATDRWDVAPNVGPVYYSSIGQGSSIDPSFSDNAQSGDVNLSYGVQISYALSDRLSVRSGISNVDLSYATSGLELGTGPVSSALRSIDYGGRQTVLIAVDKGTLGMTSEGGNPLDNVTPKSTMGEVELRQNITYYEVPLELKYALLDTKLGVNVIGGMSTLFLGNNDVSVQAGDFRDTLGEANNLSSVSFTTNVGIGFDYKISKKLKFNIEPMFKYQLNPYTDSSVDFKPYYVGVYSGLSFKF